MTKYLLIFIISSIGCYRPTKTHLTDDELRWISIYNPGDTLIFKSSRQKFDTFYISESRIYYPEFIPIEVHDEYLPHTGVVMYRHSSLSDSANSERFVYIVKKAPAHRTQLFINFLNSGYISLDINTIKRIKSNQGELFELETYHPKASLGDPRVIFWSKDLGIVEYITHDNEVWRIYNSEYGLK